MRISLKLFNVAPEQLPQQLQQDIMQLVAVDPVRLLLPCRAICEPGFQLNLYFISFEFFIAHKRGGGALFKRV